MPKKINHIFFYAVSLLMLCSFHGVTPPENEEEERIKYRIDALLREMTVEEKVGQLTQAPQNIDINPATKQEFSLDDEIKRGHVGSVINPKSGLEEKIRLQKLAVEESRLGIPLLFATDVIHGFKTIFPLPLAQASSWDMEAIEKAERIAAIEASAAGIHWTFAPMVDLSRDPRWGRVQEGSGEDPYLGARIAAARVRGFQGQNLADTTTILACVKHFAGYGAVEGGREYNTTDFSEVVLRDVHLPPFKAAIDAGVATVMTSFTTLNRVPTSASKALINDLLKTEMGFRGFTISDWDAFSELENWGVAQDGFEAALKCIKAGSDMDMSSFIYMNFLPKLVYEGKVSMEELDDAVARVLRKKFELGLFDDPFMYFNQLRYDQAMMRPEHLEAAAELARKSIVLLKNENSLLPLSPDAKSITVIGPLADSRFDNDYIGTWSSEGSNDDIVTLMDALKRKISPRTRLYHARATEGYGRGPESMMKEALRLAKKADVVVLCIGESGFMSNENTSRVDINLLPRHDYLIRKIHEMKKPIILVLFTGRPLTIEWASENIPAILLVWRPGTMGGEAIADILLGKYNPSAKLPMSFPRSVGQIPIYYNQLNTGRPDHTRWTDSPLSPLYPFGFGLSYTTFEYSQMEISNTHMTFSDTLVASVHVTNSGSRAGEEIVQMYIQDIAADVARPVKELKGFEKILLQPGESRRVEFKISVSDLEYWNDKQQYKADPGTFKIFIGPNSVDVTELEFHLLTEIEK